MSGSTSGNALRTLLSNEETALYNMNYTQSETDFNGTGTIGAPTTAPGYLFIDLASGSTVGNLFVPAGYGFIENVNDTSPIIGADNTAAASTLFYLGDSSSQTFYSGNSGSGTDYIAMTGFNNLAVTSNSSGGTYVIAAGLQAAGTSLQTLATPGTNPDGSTQGNTVVAGAGQVSIAAGLGANLIFLGSGNDYAYSEGQDTFAGGAGAATISADSSGAALQSDVVYQGAGAITFFAGSGLSTVLGGTGTASLVVTGSTGAVTAYGGAGSNEFAGGSNGNNLLVAGSGNSTLFGGGSGDTLVGAGTADTIVAGSGNETLFGSASGTDAIFGGTGPDVIVLNGGQDYVQFNAGNDTVFTGSGSELFGYQTGGAGGTELISGFNAATDFFSLDSTTGATGASVIATDTVAGGNTLFAFSNTVTVDLLGVTNLSASSFFG